MRLLQFIITGVLSSAPYMLLAYAFVLTNQASGVFNLALGSAYVVAGYALYELCTVSGLPFIVGFVVAILGSALLNLVIYEFLFKPVIARTRSLVGMLVIAVGAVTVVSYGLSYLSHYQSFNYSQPFLNGDIRIGSLDIPSLQLVFLIISCLVLGAAELFIRRTGYGLAVTALSDNEELAETVGIRTQTIIRGTYLVAGALAGLSAIFQATVVGLTPFDGLDAIVIASIAALIGGMRHRPFAVLGAVFLGVVQGISLQWVSGEWQDAITYGVLIIVIIVLPRGLAGLTVGAERR